MAVALKYDREKRCLPAVPSAGHDETTQRLKAAAAEHYIPRVKNIELARALAREEQVGQPIKAKWFSRPGKPRNGGSR